MLTTLRLPGVIMFIMHTEIKCLDEWLLPVPRPLSLSIAYKLS